MNRINLSSLISARLQFRKGNAFSGIVIAIAKGSIALGLAILVVSVLIYAGFIEAIQNKIFSVSGHLSIRQFSTGSLYEEQPLEKSQAFIDVLKSKHLISHAQTFAFKPALIKSESEVEGVILKGIDSDFNFKLFNQNLKKPVSKAPAEGEIWMSSLLAKKLGLSQNSQLFLFFLQNPPRYRKMVLSTIFQSGLEDVDQNLVIVNQSLVQEMNEWKSNQTGGFELFVPDFKLFDMYLEEIESIVPYNLAVEPITTTHSQLFEWLEIIGRNVLVMFILISLVSGFNMAATLLIMVMERRQMVGILKALGANNSVIRQIFYRNGIRIIVQGLVLGNAIGLSLAWLQYKWAIIPLDEANYYLSAVPIAWDWSSVIGINVGVLLITSIVLLIPVRLVNKINVREAILTN